MRTRFLYLALSILLFSCHETESPDAAQPVLSRNSGPDTKEYGKDTCYLESLFRLKDSADFSARFGTEAVVHDSVWTEEGTVLRYTSYTNGACPEVRVYWSGKNFQGPHSVSAEYCFPEAEAKRVMIAHGAVYPGMSLRELVTRNEAVITFAGFGWDRSGIVTSFGGGKLEKQGMGISLGYTENADYPKSLMGDRLIRSDAPEADPDRLRVRRIILINPLYID